MDGNCQDCGSTYWSPGQTAGYSTGCPNCGSMRFQPSPTHDEMGGETSPARDMASAAGDQMGVGDPGGNPLCLCGCGEPTLLSQHNYLKRGIKKGDHSKYINGHNPRGPHPLGDWKEKDTGFETLCWIFKDSENLKQYGNITRPDLTGRTQIGAHRFFYEHYKGTIPKDLFLDHLCRTPACVNPDHLEAVSVADNTRRGEAAKLNWDKVNEIRVSISLGTSINSLAAKYHVERAMIRQIRNNKNWVDLSYEAPAPNRDWTKLGRSLYDFDIDSERLKNIFQSRDEAGCWYYTGAGRSPKGYIKLWSNTQSKYFGFQIYRVFYEIAKGRIPSEYVVDHLCCNRKCVNPDHLEAVTNEENQRRRVEAYYGSV